jgi:hypothetical protein
MLVSLSVIVHLGLRIVGGVFSGRYFDLTFDPGVRHVCLHVYYTVYTPMVNQVQNNSTLVMGLTTKIPPGLESFKKLLPTWMTSSKK